jgi:hypothetical protein
MFDGESIVMSCPVVLEVDSDEGRLVGPRISYWCDEDIYGARRVRKIVLPAHSSGATKGLVNRGEGTKRSRRSYTHRSKAVGTDHE